MAGTNGKGSTCAILESIYRAAGLRVGLFTSPHLVSFGERIQVNRREISEEDTVRLVLELRPLLASFPQEHHPTFFEFVTVMALRYFAQQRCDLVVWETGLGGRLDATNIVIPLVSVITNIQYDHEKWLGETLSSIAREKAGIIKPGVPVVTAAEGREALDVIEATAARQGSPLTIVPPEAAACLPFPGLRLPLLGRHQRMNAATALAATEVLQPAIPLDPTSVRTGLQSVDWPGRLQMITRASGQQIVLDGAHNPGGASILANALREYFPGRRPTMIIGILADKDWPTMCDLWAPLATRMFIVPVHSERTADPHQLAQKCKAANPALEIIEFNSLREALDKAAADRFVVIAGSLYLIGEALEVLDIAHGRSVSERELNEWGSASHPHQPSRAS